MERQPYRSILEVLCEAGSVPRPRNLLHDNTVLRAANSWSLGLNIDLDTVAEIRSPPSAQTFPTVKARAFPPTNAATLLTAFPWSCSNDKLLSLCSGFQIYIFYNDVIDTNDHFC